MADDFERRKKLIATIRQFRLIDDTYFNMFMEDNAPCMELFLRLILKNPALHVEEIRTNEVFENRQTWGDEDVRIDGEIDGRRPRGEL